MVASVGEQIATFGMKNQKEVLKNQEACMEEVEALMVKDLAKDILYPRRSKQLPRNQKEKGKEKAQ